MDNEFYEEGDKFAMTACQLLREYTQRLQDLKQELMRLAEKIHGARASKMDMAYAETRYHHEMLSFQQSLSTYHKLMRQASQWIEHGKVLSPHLRLELEIRLDDFERLVRTTEDLLHSGLLR
jgi:hypothetical protein